MHKYIALNILKKFLIGIILDIVILKNRIKYKKTRKNMLQNEVN